MAAETPTRVNVIKLEGLEDRVGGARWARRQMDRQEDGWIGGGAGEGRCFFIALCIAAHQPAWLVSVKGVTPVSHLGRSSHCGCKALANASTAL